MRRSERMAYVELEAMENGKERSLVGIFRLRLCSRPVRFIFGFGDEAQIDELLVVGIGRW